MYESNPKQIARELTTRDSIANDDFLGFIFDTYHDGLNGVGFYTTAAGTQYDAKYAPNPNGNSEDATWNAVWDSKVHIDNQGWTAEFKKYLILGSAFCQEGCAVLGFEHRAQAQGGEQAAVLEMNWTQKRMG